MRRRARRAGGTGRTGRSRRRAAPARCADTRRSRHLLEVRMRVRRQRVGEERVDPRAAELARRQADAVHDDQVRRRCPPAASSQLGDAHLPRAIRASPRATSIAGCTCVPRTRWRRCIMAQMMPPVAARPPIACIRLAGATTHEAPAAREHPRRARPARRLAPVHPDEGPRVAADDPDRARRRASGCTATTAGATSTRSAPGG